MFDLLTPVVALVESPEGPIWQMAVVVGRSFCEPPRYDVRVAGAIHANVEARHVRPRGEAQAA